MQTVFRMIYPPTCVACDEAVDEPDGMCAACWLDTRFITGHVCDACGAPLPGQSDGHRDLCDDCMRTERPWESGRAAMVYSGSARRMILGLKHGDRTDLAKPAAKWMRAAGGPVLAPARLIVPVPVHWTRLVRRRYNQSAALSAALARLTGQDWDPRALKRIRSTPLMDGMTPDERRENVANSIVADPSRASILIGREVVLVDDVMTSGATLAASARACLEAGASRVFTLVMARVAKDA